MVLVPLILYICAVKVNDILDKRDELQQALWDAEDAKRSEESKKENKEEDKK